jgi:ribosomal protein S18 acetylase RimI-like enzyme
MLNLRVIGTQEWVDWRSLRLAALEEAPQAFTSKLADWQAADEERWFDRLTDVGLNMIADLDGRPAGMISATVPDATGAAELISTWVTPAARGHGVGDAMVDAVIAWAVDQGADRVVLSVAPHNDHAAALYRRHGFVDAGEPRGHSERQMVRTIVGP